VTGDGDNTVILNDAAVRRLPARRSDVTAGLAKALVILGDSGDTARLDLGNYASAGTNAGRNVYRRTDASYGLEVSADITISAP
jgi:hypothetical protein